MVKRVSTSIFFPISTLYMKRNPPDFIPENRLPVAMFGSVFLPISLFWFGWTSASSVPWIVPTIGSAFFSVSVFLLFQAGLKYVPRCWELSRKSTSTTAVIFLIVTRATLLLSSPVTISSGPWLGRRFHCSVPVHSISHRSL